MQYHSELQRFSSDTSEYSSSKAVSDVSACMMIDKDFFRQKGEPVSYLHTAGVHPASVVALRNIAMREKPHCQPPRSSTRPRCTYTSRWLFAESSRDVRRVNLPWLSFSMCLLDSPHNFGQDLHLHWRS